MVLGWIAFAAVLVILLAMAVHFYNRFQVLENRCNESWSNVDTELKRRHDLIPNLVSAIKGYAEYERDILKAVTNARAMAGQVDPLGRAKVEGLVASSVDRLLAVAEAYPELKAAAGFRRLQQELALAEDRIQAARRFYNSNVRDLLNATRQFPGNLFAVIFKPDDNPFFQVDKPHLLPPAVKV